jgi:Amt family ammonium transporter
MGWFGFNGGSQLALSSAADATAIGTVFVNTNAAAAAGVVGALLVSKLTWGKADLTMILNGALGGLVAITADPASPARCSPA